MSKKDKNSLEQDKYYRRLKSKLEVDRVIEQEEERTITTKSRVTQTQKPTSVGRKEENEQDQNENEQDQNENEQDQDEKQEREDSQKQEENEGKNENKDRTKDGVGKEAGEKVEKEALEKEGRQATKVGGKATKELGQAAWQGVKTASASAWEALVGLLAEASPVVLVILLIVLILIVVTIWALRGTGATQLPNQEIDADRQDVAETACMAGDCKLAQQEAKKIADEVDQEIESEKEQATKNYWPLAKADSETNFSNIDRKKELINTNYSALSSMDGESQSNLELMINNYQLVKSTIADLNADSTLSEMEGLREKLTKLDQYNQKIITGLKALNSGDKEPILLINQYDLRLIKEFKIDIRLTNLLNELAEKSQAEGDQPLKNISAEEIYQIIRSPKASRTKKIRELTARGKEWSQIKVSKIVQSDPESVEDQVTQESDASYSAHYGGKAADISVVGNYKCETKGFLGIGDKKKWYPCQVAYQTSYRPPGLNNYLNPNLNNLAASISLPGYSGSELNLDQVVTKVGLSQVAQELGIDPRYLTNGNLLEDGVGSAYIEDALGLPVGGLTSIVENEGDVRDNLGRRYFEEVLGLPNGSLTGDSQDEILKSIGLAIIKKGLGLEYSNWSGSWSNQSLGQAVVENSYRVNYSDDVLNKIIDQNQNQFIRKTGIKGTSNNSNTTLNQIGQAYKQRLSQSQTDQGLSKSIGLPSSTISQLKSGSNQALTTAGLIGLANALGIDPNLSSGGIIGRGDLFSLIENGQFSSPLGLTNNQIINIVATNEDNQRTAEIKSLGQQIIDRIKDRYLDQTIREKLADLTGIDYYQVGAKDIQDLLSDNDKTERYIKSVGESLQRDLFYRYRPAIGGYQLSIYDYEDIKDGNWQEVVDRVGSSYVEAELGLPGNSFVALFDSSAKTEEVVARAGLALILSQFGVDDTNSYEWFDEWSEETGDKDLNLRFGQAVVESKGLTNGTFFGDISDIIKQNGVARVASSLNLTTNELQSIIDEGGSINNQTIIEKLVWADSSLNLDQGTTQKFIDGDISAEDYSRQVARAQLFGLSNSDIAQIVGMDEKPDFDYSIANLILSPDKNDNQKIITALSKLYDQYLGQELGWPKDLFLSQITNNPDSRDRALSAGIDQLSLILTNGNRRQAGVLGGLFNRSYIQGEDISQDQYLNAGLNFIGVNNTTISDRGVILDLLNGNLDSAFDSIEKAVIADQFEQTLIGTWVDLRLDSAIGLTREEISIINNTYQSWKSGQASDGQLLTVLNNSFEFVDPGVTDLLTGQHDYLDIANMFFDEEFFEVTGISINQARQIRDIYQQYQDGSVSENDFYIGLASGLGIDRDIVEGASIANNIISGGQIGTGTIGYLLYQTGVGQEIDQATSVNGFSRGLLIGLVTGNWYELGISVLGSILGIGETKCQDPAEITQAHIRELIGWTLQSEEPPLQILTFRKEDVNYYNGLDEQGENDINGVNLVEQVFGPTSDRGNRGLFANNYMWNHIHIAY